MTELSELATTLEKEFELDLEIMSGGHSANYDWYQSTGQVGRVNNLRLGESIFLGLETAHRNPIPGLHTGVFKLITEVIESKKKPSLPFGETCQDAFGEKPRFLNRGIRNRAIIALGKQDTQISGLISENHLTLLGASSDHIIFDNEKHKYGVGDEIRFNLDYGGLLSAMTSSYIHKRFTEPYKNSLQDHANEQ